jgi:hypothetical protein
MTQDNWIKLIVAVAAVIAAGAFITFRISKKNSNNKTINQNNNKVTGGDIVGGDKTTK